MQTIETKLKNELPEFALNGSAVLSVLMGVSSLMYLTGKKPPDALVAVGLISSVVVLANDTTKILGKV